jgi:hypothetical protein
MTNIKAHISPVYGAQITGVSNSDALQFGDAAGKRCMDVTSAVHYFHRLAERDCRD